MDCWCCCCLRLSFSVSSGWGRGGCWCGWMLHSDIVTRFCICRFLRCPIFLHKIFWASRIRIRINNDWSGSFHLQAKKVGKTWSGAFLIAVSGMEKNEPRLGIRDETWILSAYNLIRTVYLNECFVSRSWWIRIDLALLDPGSHWECQEQGNWPKWTNKPNFQPLKMAFLPTQVCFMIYYLHEVYFSCKKSNFLTFVTASLQGSGSGSALTHIDLAPWIQIRIEVKAGSGSALKPNRIRNTDLD